MARDPLLTFTDRGIFCPEGGFYIDPPRGVERAVLTHGHADHARGGSGAYLASAAAVPVIRARLGAVAIEGLGWGEVRRIGGVEVSFHPAGHVPGSAQVRVARGGEVWVVSGDYKLEPDGLCEPFEPVACHAFVSECTFGLPVFRWAPQGDVVAEILRWWAETAAASKAAVIGAYSLGKAQRLIAALRDGPGPICAHPAVEGMSRILRAQGYAVPEVQTLGAGTRAPAGALVIAPPAALGEAGFARRIGPHETAFASGWMALRGVRRRQGLGRGFVISDHADWPALNRAIAATGAGRVFVTHGYTAPFARWLREQGLDADVVATGREAREGEGEGE
ncbi:MAG: ligase-associated DNA damage response exonuclease [Gemmobacter sp.]